jgi:FOG: Transposase and inactivated derivatives
MKLFPWADYHRMKAAFKLHVGLDHDGLIPCFARITTGRISENEPAHQFTAPHGSVVVLDQGYHNYQWHNSLTSKGIYWVSRLRGNAVYRAIERRAVTPDSPITSDQIIHYASPQKSRDELPPIRRIGYRDPQTGKHYVFITNHVNWSAQTIADIYKQRWQVELFFKWIKQNLKIKSFLGNSKNAVLTQVLVALWVYLLMAFIKFQSKVTLSLQQMKRLLQTNLFAKRCMRELFEKRKPDKNISPQFALALARR